MIPICIPFILKRGPLDRSKMVNDPITYVAMWLAHLKNNFNCFWPFLWFTNAPLVQLDIFHVVSSWLTCWDISPLILCPVASKVKYWGLYTIHSDICCIDDNRRIYVNIILPSIRAGLQLLHVTKFFGSEWGLNIAQHNSWHYRHQKAVTE